MPALETHLPENAYYIYALKDLRSSPAKPFYIGKGTGIRAWEHTLKADKGSKSKRISEILAAKMEVVVTKLADNLTEFQALKPEAELISAFGTESSGGILLGAPERAQLGLGMLKQAVLELAQTNTREGKMVRVEKKRHVSKVK